MNRKIRKCILLLPLVLLVSITFNFVQKSFVDNGHTHYEHDSLILIHKHSHTDNTTHSHYHSSTNVSVLDYFVLKNENILIDKQDKNKPLDLITFYLNDLKDSLFKPPRFS